MKILAWHARDAKNLTLYQLAAMTDLSKSTLNNIENGKTSPTINQLEDIAAALNVHITDLFDSKWK